MSNPTVKMLAMALTNHGIFSVEPDGTAKEWESLETLDELAEQAKDHKIQSVGIPNILSMSRHFKEIGYSPEQIILAAQNYPRLVDKLLPRKVDYVYLKLDTGGFPGYNRRLQGMGENELPILRVTAKVNDNDPLDVIVNPGAMASNIQQNTVRFHQGTGLWDKALQSKFRIARVDESLGKKLDELGVKPHRPEVNHHTHLVGYNTSFLRSFMEAQLPTVGKLFGLQDIDIYRFGSMARVSGLYELEAHPQLWGSEDPLGYVNHLRDVHCKLMEQLAK